MVSQPALSSIFSSGHTQHSDSAGACCSLPTFCGLLFRGHCRHCPLDSHLLSSSSEHVLNPDVCTWMSSLTLKHPCLSLTNRDPTHDLSSWKLPYHHGLASGVTLPPQHQPILGRRGGLQTLQFIVRALPCVHCLSLTEPYWAPCTCPARCI